MKFKYKKYQAGILRPVIPVEISYNNRSVAYEALVDSGADFCIFPAEIGELFGIDIFSGEPGKVGGIVGVPEVYYIHPVIIKVGGWPHAVRVGFLPSFLV